jgi:hypothetical protein
LRDFGLIGGVAGQELAALDQMIDAGGDMMLVGAAAEEEGRFACREIHAGQRGHMPLDRDLRRVRGKASDRAVELGDGGHIDEQIVDRGRADRPEHRAAIDIGEGKVAHRNYLPPP